MTSEPTRPHPGGLRLGRRVLHQLRSALERDTGLQASTYLQEAGFAGGEELYAEFREWLAANRGVEEPTQLDAEFLSNQIGDIDIQTRRLLVFVDKTEYRDIQRYADTHFAGIHNVLQIGGGRGDDADAAQQQAD